MDPVEPESVAAEPDRVIWGVTRGGARFRPSDWAERLAGLTAAFHLSDRLRFSSLVEPATISGARAIVVSGKLKTAEPRLYQFLLGFARDNDLVVQTLAEGEVSLQTLVPPLPAPPGEPREPV
ncbi:MAG: DUF3579 domain-containing protein [Casimicrobiaceae bacterium]